MKKLTDLLNNIDHQLIGDSQRNVSMLCFDSRKATNQSMFICIKGLNTDGHQYIPQVISKGSQTIVCEEMWFNSQLSVLSEEVTWIVVKNTVKSMAQLAANFYDNPSSQMKLIGITGTNGKTTTAHLIEFILNEAQKPTGMIGTLYYRLKEFNKKAPYTSPFPIELQELIAKMKHLEAKQIVMECSSHALHQHRLDTLVFDSAIFTNLSQDHLDYHQDMNDYLEAKMYLFKNLLSPKGTSIINLDDSMSDNILSALKDSKVITYGTKEKADFRATHIKHLPQGLHFVLETKGSRIPIQLQLMGHFNLLNSLAALANASLYIPIDVAIKHLETFQGVPGRFEKVTSAKSPFTVIVDYAHTPDSLANLIQTARQFVQGKIICMFGCGGDRDQSKRPLMGAIAEELSDLVVVTSDNPRTENPDKIIKDILDGMKKNIGTLIQTDRKKAISQAILYAREGDVVLIAGKGHEDYQILNDKSIYFDDRIEAKKVLETLCQHPF